METAICDGGYYIIGHIPPSGDAVSSVFASIHPLAAHKFSRLHDKNTEPGKFRGSYAGSPRSWPVRPRLLTLMTGAAIKEKIGLLVVIDALLDEHACIAPGFGDAVDRQFGMA